MKRVWTWTMLALLAAVLVAGYLSWQRPPAMEHAASGFRPAPQPAASAASSDEAPEPPTRLQLDAGTPGQALPTLDDSDAALASALAGFPNRSAWQALLRPERLIRRIVATVDNLPRSDAPVDTWPLAPAPGWLATQERDGASYVAPANAERYARHVASVGGLDAERAVAVYLRFYPLFQRAYEELGFPGKYFNDRVKVAIDDLLATPEPSAPLELAPANVRYRLADPDLDRRSAGQRILLRIGTDNARIVKAKLREIRQALARHERPAGDPAQR